LPAILSCGLKSSVENLMSQKWSSHRLSEQSAHAWKSEEGGSVTVQVIALRAKLDHEHLLAMRTRSEVGFSLPFEGERCLALRPETTRVAAVNPLWT
jgi:hypothetical protein